VSYGDIRRWSAEPLHQTENTLRGQGNLLIGLADELDISGRTPGWVGPASMSARRRHFGLRNDLEDAVAQLAAVRRAMGDAGDRIEALMAAVADTEELARSNDFGIDETGWVHDFLEGPRPEPDRQRLGGDLTERVQGIVRRAEEIDQIMLSVLERTRLGEIDEHGAANLEQAAQLGETQGGLHGYLLDRYQVSPDPDGTTMWPEGAAGWLAERGGQEKVNVTIGEARMLDDLRERQGWYGVKEALDIKELAEARAETVFGGELNADGHANAFRHAYWNALMTQRFGEEWAADFATAHERAPAAHPTPVAMDLYNNEVGRRIAVEHPDADPEELAELVQQAVSDGETVVVDRNQQLTYSNETPVGDTPTAPWPEENLGREGHTDPGEPDAVPNER
jgi:hypothetical protein